MAAPMARLLARRPGYLVGKFAAVRFPLPAVRRLHGSTSLADAREFEPSVLDTIVCPLSKEPLRYDAEASELVNDELGVAYKVVDGIPNLIPQDARMIMQDKDAAPTADSESKDRGS